MTAAVGKDGAFDFTDAGGCGTFALGTTDVALDGLVIAMAAGATSGSLSVTPLKRELV